jgi:polyisoprenyl-teichoic acid--peptidoglycan teichoic acid transferase
MPKDLNRKHLIVHFIRAYGINALIGFGIGVVLVVLAFVFIGRPGAPGMEARSGNQVNPLNTGEIKSQENEQLKGHESNNVQNEALNNNNSTSLDLKNRFTVLLVGTDNRPKENYISNTDTLIVASIDQKDKKIVLLSIPRDTQVLLPDGTKEKINSLARLGKGVSSTKQYVEELIGNPIDGYVLTSFEGFKDIIDSLGGITVNVEKNMFYDTGDNQDRYINLKKGTQRLNGTQALQYARFRNDELADISRAERQQVIIKAMVSEATEPRNIPKLPFIVPKVYQSVQTNLNISQLWSLAMAVKDREKYEVINQTLPGKFSTEEVISYWKVNPKESKQILGSLFQGKKSPVFGYSNSSNAPKKEPETKGPETRGSEQKNNTQSSGVKTEGMDARLNHEDEGITFEVIDP